MNDEKKISHAQHLKAVNHPIRREMLRIINEQERISKADLLKSLLDQKVINSEDVFGYNMDFLIQSICVEKSEINGETFYSILPAGKVIENF
jgi:hypothetical protein